MKLRILLLGLIFLPVTCLTFLSQTQPRSLTLIEDIAKMVDRLLSLDPFTREGIEQVLATKLRRQPEANPFLSFYKGRWEKGPFVSVEYKEPRPGATSNERILSLEVRPGFQITQQQVSARYGAATIVDIIAHAQPDGLVTFGYEIGGRKLFFRYNGRTYELEGVTVWGREPIAEERKR